MALPNLTNQNIQDTYQRVVQTDGKQIFDGTGSLLPLEIDGNNVIVSGTISATEYIVTSSVTHVIFQQQSGSTLFGDSGDDTHRFTGSIFSSGNINIEQDASNGDIGRYQIGGVTLLRRFTSSEAQPGHIAIGSAVHHLTQSAAGMLFDSTLDIQLDSNVGLVHFSDSGANTVTVNTTKGNISASGAITASDGFLGDLVGNAATATTATTAVQALVTAGTLTVDNTTLELNSGTTYNGSADRTISIKDDITLSSLTSTHITASGNVSASKLIAAQFQIPSSSGTDVLSWGTLTNSLLHNYIFVGNTSNIVRFEASQHQYTNTSGDQANVRYGSSPYSAWGGDDAQISMQGDLFVSSHITASANISASGTSHIFGGNISIDQDLLHIGDSDTKISFSDADQIDLQTGGNIKLRLANTLNTLNQDTKVDGDLFTTGHITASGDISASGNVYADRYHIKGPTNDILGLYLSSDVVMIGDVGNRLQTNATSINFANGDITASANISASGDIICGTSKIGLRDLGHTEHTTVGTTAQGDIFNHGSTTTIPGAIYGHSSNGNVVLAQTGSHLNADFTGSLFMAVSTDSSQMLLRGMIKGHTAHDANFGQALYLSSNGSASLSPPTQTNAYARIIGHVMSGSGTMYFNPDSTYVKIS